MLDLKHINKSYGKTVALTDINLLLSRGIYGLLGPNGAGKTTLLKIMASIISPDKGQVLWNDEPVNMWSRHYHDNIGYLPQDFTPYMDISVFQFLQYMGGLKDIPPKLLPNRIQYVLSLVKIEGDINTLIHKLSRGIIQRLGIACAILNDPQILILDEPLNGLDGIARREILDIFLSISKRKTIILSSHITDDLETIVEKVIILSRGYVKAFNSPLYLTGNMEGLVWEIEAGKNSLEAIKSSYYLPRIKSFGSHYIVRVVGPKPSEGNYKSMDATLEDIFLYYTAPRASIKKSPHATSNTNSNTKSKGSTPIKDINKTHT